MPNVMGREFPYTPEGMAAADNYRRAMGMRGGGMMGFRPLGYKDGGTPSPGLRFEPTESAAQFLENLRTKHPVAFIEHVFHTHGIPREETRQQLEEEGILPPEGLITFENRGEFTYYAAKGRNGGTRRGPTHGLAGPDGPNGSAHVLYTL